MQLLSKSGKTKAKDEKQGEPAPRPPPKFAKVPFPESLFAKPRPIP